MNRFGEDTWTANWDQPTSSSEIVHTDPATGQQSDIPYYLANSVPDASVPAGGSYSQQEATPWATYPTYNAGGSSQGSSGVPGDITSGGQGARQPDGPGFDWTGAIGGIFKNIFGHPVTAQGAPIVAAPVDTTPTWVWVALPVAGLAVFAFILKSANKPRSVAGYRRKKRSKR